MPQRGQHEAPARGRARTSEDADGLPAYVRQSDGNGPGAVRVCRVYGRRREDGSLRLALQNVWERRVDHNGVYLGTFWRLMAGEVYEITNANGVTWYATPRNGVCVGLFASEVEQHARKQEGAYLSR